jgi:hypothetical protein
MAIIIPISTKTIENPLLKKLKALDKIRAEKAIAAYNKRSLAMNKAGKI